MIKKVFFSLIFFTSLLMYSQQSKSINDYKYIIVPAKFHFVKATDGYQTSSLTKFLFKKYGFTAFLSNERLPDDLAKDRCLSLTANVIDNSGMFSTKQNIVLKDCFSNTVYRSDEGRSKEKEYKKAYHGAIRKAFESIKRLKYSYQPVKEKASVVHVVVPEKKVKVIQPEISSTVTVPNIKVNTLYAQPKENGFQLVNATPEIVFHILKTTNQDVFILKDKNGILYKQNGSWVAEYYENNQIVKKQFQIKF